MPNYDVVRSVDELETLWSQMVEQGLPIGFDIETGYHGPDNDRGSLKMETNILVGFSFTNSEDWARYVPMAHDFDENITDHLGIAVVLWKYFQSGLIVAHNLGFELRRMSRFFREMLSEHPIYGEQVRASNGYFPYRSDTQVEAYVRRETFMVPHPKEDRLVEYSEFALKELVMGAFQHKMIQFEELFAHMTGKQKKTYRFNVLNLTSQVVTYACEDSVWCLKLHLRNYDKVRKQLVYKIDMELIPVICEMEDCGIVYDWAFMKESSERAKQFATLLNDEIQTELTAMLGLGEAKLNVNLGSPKQLSEILYDKLGFKVPIYTTGTKSAAPEDKKMSTGKEALDYLAEKYPIAKKINHWRNVTKLCGSFLDKYAKDYGDTPDGRIHSSLNQSYVRTARFSSSNPNQQNQPAVNLKKDDNEHELKCSDKEKCTGCKNGLSYKLKLQDGTKFEMNFRDSVIAPEGWYILGFDLSQAEYRAVAGHANETAMIEAFESGVDIHKFVASMMFRIPMGEVTKEYRSKAKTLGFGLLYGMDSRSLAKRLSISQEEAEALFNQYFTAFPRIKKWTEGQVDFGYKHGFVVSKFGRKIPIPELRDSRRWIRASGERGCYNYPIQGGATGDYLRLVMVKTRRIIKNLKWEDKVKLFMNVHDALEFYVRGDMNPAEVLNALQPGVIFPVEGWPLLVADWHIGKRWGSVHELELLEGGQVRIVDGPLITPGTLYLPTVEDDDLVWTVVKEQTPVQESEVFKNAEQPEELNTEPVSRQIIVSIDHLPTDTQYDRFMAITNKLSGLNTVLMETPEGTYPLEVATRLDADNAKHVNAVSLALGGARMRYADEKPVDIEALAAGIVF